MLTIKKMLSGRADIDENVLVEISDKLWKIGFLADIEEKVSPDLFLLHIGINMVGNWQCDGWWYIICDQAKLIPYIPKALEAFGLYDLKEVFENIISIFPEYTVFSNDDSTYYDIINFLQNVRFKVNDERLNSIEPEKRKEMAGRVSRKLDILEDMTSPLWAYGTECDGWKHVIDFIGTDS